jgi:hypothetical protein
MPNYYSEPKETYKDAEDAEERPEVRKSIWELVADPAPK